MRFIGLLLFALLIHFPGLTYGGTVAVTNSDATVLEDGNTAEFIVEPGKQFCVRGTYTPGTESSVTMSIYDHAKINTLANGTSQFFQIPEEDPVTQELKFKTYKITPALTTFTIPIPKGDDACRVRVKMALVGGTGGKFVLTGSDSGGAPLPR